jgi:hypothetical protein
MFFINFEILKEVINKVLDLFMPIFYWHPLNHQMWFDTYRTMSFTDRKSYTLSFALKTIDEKYNANKLQKVDYFCAYIRMFIIIAGVFALMVIICAE